MKRTALIDSDILLYEVGFSSQSTELDEQGLPIITPASWEFVEDLFQKKIDIILHEAEADDYILYLTNTPRISKMLNKKRVWQGEKKKEYVDNFRNEVAKEKVYKGTRKADKPVHFYNLLAHILGTYPYHVAEDGIEADDAMVLEQYSRLDKLDTIICSRDKDLRMCPGWYYAWEVGFQPSVGPLLIDPLGYLTNVNEGKKDGKGTARPVKVFGVGAKFFYYQLIVGDTIDNIGGIKGKGPAFALKLLADAETERQCYELVAEVYVKTWGDEWKEKITEQAQLLWMVREVNEDGSHKMWRPPPMEK